MEQPKVTAAGAGELLPMEPPARPGPQGVTAMATVSKEQHFPPPVPPSSRSVLLRPQAPRSCWGCCPLRPESRELPSRSGPGDRGRGAPPPAGSPGGGAGTGP